MGQIQVYKVKNWVVFGRNRFTPPFKVSDALINEARIVHVVKGNSRLYSANRMVSLSDGDTLVMKTDNFVNHWEENEDGSTNEVIAFQLTSDFLKHIYNNNVPHWFTPGSESGSHAVEKADPSPIIQGYFQSLTYYLNQPSQLSEDIIQLKIKELLNLLVQTDASGQMRQILGNLFQTAEYDFQEIIQKNLFENLTLDELAFLTGKSLSSFKRKFNSIYGTTPNKYIVSKRLEKAQTLLSTSQLHISEIAYECGFSDVSYFSKTFKKHYNTSPSEIRK